MDDRASKISRSKKQAVLLICFLILLPALISTIPLIRVLAQQHTGSLISQDGKEIRVLEQGKPHERELKAGERHSYQVTLTSGMFVRVALDLQDIDVVVTVWKPNGKSLAEISRQSTVMIAEPIVFVSEASGIYRLEVRAPEKGASAGRYGVSIEELRAATAQDQNRIVAERVFAQGAQLQYAQGTAEALRTAVKKYEEALALWQAIGDHEEEGRTLGSLGTVLSSLGEYQKAIGYYTRNLEIIRAIKDRKQEASLLETIGWLYYNSLSDKENASKYLNQALQLYQDAGHRQGEARTLTMLGKLYYHLGQSLEEKRRSLDYFVRVLAIHHENKDRFYEGDALGNLMLAWKALQNPRLSIFYGKEAVNTYQELRSSIKDLEKDTQKTFLKSKEETYRTLADLLISEGRLPEAQQVLRMLKEEEYFEFIRRDSNEASGLMGRAAMTPEEAEWEKRYSEVADQLTVRGRERGELLAKATRTAAEEQRLSQIEKDLILAREAFQKFLDRLDVELGNTKQAAKVSQLREAQGLAEDLRELGSGAVALYTLVGEEKYRVVLFTPDVQRHYEYPIKAADLSRKVAAFREVLQNPNVNPLPAAQELYKILVGPVAKDLKDAGAETLMWSLDGVLRYIPIAALHDGEKFMLERYRNVVFTLESQSRLKDAPSAKWSALGFGVSKPHTGFSSLPAVPEELRGIIRDESAGASTGGVIPGKVMLDEAFTEERMKTLLRQKYPVVHVASHFAFKPGNETDSFLLLGDGQRLSLAQIKTSMSFGGVELLTLSACDTAMGSAGADGKEVEGFAVLAQRQGAKAVMASLWPVADQSTRLLMQRFYQIRDAQAGTLKAEALRQAQLSLLRGEEKTAAGDERRRGISTEVSNSSRSGTMFSPKAPFAHPFFWAPFMLIGNWK